MLSSGSAIAFTLCVLYFVNPAVSMKCYDCSSKDDADCIFNPKQDKFAKNCTDTHPRVFAGIIGYLNIGSFAGKKNVTEFQCIKTIVQTTDKTHNRTTTNLYRGCISKSETCEHLKSGLLPGEKMDTCELCRSDSCNSSSIISAGLHSLVITLAMLFAFWR